MFDLAMAISVIISLKELKKRYGREIGNSRVSYDTLLKTSSLTAEQQRTLQKFSYKKNWSNRTQIKMIRLVQTI
ncbi:hypothetical protein DFO73_102300 [Cytobacillus oceanisediminis]|uniref:Uncharacterized protein n=2 Tax=Cytobacillus oceanisediminis TaxID=665099 RepID=A0A2V3ACR1_9BACI|nr:hypothetical protein DFO73_102300 [Cytobacillus oceanisediminis]